MKMNALSPAVLLYQVEGERAGLIDEMCRLEGIRPVHVSPEQENVPVGLLAGADDWRVPALMKDLPPAGPVTEEMAVFCGVSEKQLDRIIARMRAGNAPISLKAVLTRQNAVWNGRQLQSALRAERGGL